MITALEIRDYCESDQEAVVQLWGECGLTVPWNDPVKDIRRKLHIQRDLFRVGLLGNRLVGTVMAGYEGHRGWINYLAVALDCQKTGYGRRLMEEAEMQLRTLVTNATKFALEMIGAKVAFSDQELAAARTTSESFAELFRKNDEDNLGLLLLPKDAIGKVLNANVLEDTDEDTLYAKMVKANTQRFREFRSMFTDLSKTSIITFQAGHMAKSDFYTDGVRMMKNSFVTLAYSNRVEVKIKIEEMVAVDGKFFIVEID